MYNVSKIKICGLFRERDIDFVNEAAPDYVGFVFARSRRQVSVAEALWLRENLKDGIIPVGVFVNAPKEHIVSLYQNQIIAIAQLHGEEDEAYIRSLKSLCSMPVIKALNIDGAKEAGERREPSMADYLLFDSGPGGTGKSFDWSLLDSKWIQSHWFLAGGINADNIGVALALNPYCVDVSSGAESNGVKDRDKIIRLVQQVREHTERCRGKA
jgi:phosphoribosylanthranilate isomerase